MTQSTSRLATFEQRTEWPLAFAAVLFLISYATPILDPRLPASIRRACEISDYALWAVFVVEFVARVSLVTQRRGWYLFRHIPELLTLALPVLRPLRLLRLVVLLRVMNRRAADSLRGRVATYVGVSTTLVVFCAALAALDAERGHAHATITNFADAMWWAMTTITTVGYGDTYPVTGEGRVICIGLMISGIALLGVVTASIASWLIDRVRDIESDQSAATDHELRALRDEIAELRTLIVAMSGHESAHQR